MSHPTAPGKRSGAFCRDSFRASAWSLCFVATLVLSPATSRGQDAAAPADGSNQFGAEGNSSYASYLPSVGSGRSFEVFTLSDIEPTPGTFTWTAVDGLVRQFGQAGIQLMFKLTTCGLTEAGADFWGTPSVPGDSKLPPGPCTSVPPLDSGEYSDFIFNVVSRYKNTKHVPYVVRYFAIGNEINDRHQWPGRARRRRCVIDERTGAEDCPAFADYLAMLKRATTAAHAANPQAVILDSGLGSRVWGLAIAREKYEDAGRTKDALLAAVAFYNKYYQARYRTPLLAGVDYVNPSPSSTLRARFEALVYAPYDPDGPNPALNVPLGDRYYYFAKHMFDDPAAFDALQLHFYDEWSHMNDVVTWIQKQMDDNWGPGKRKPILCWECGSHWPVVDSNKDGRGELWNFDVDEYSARLIKRDVIGVSRGLGHLSHAPFTWVYPIPGTDRFDSVPLICAPGSAKEPLLCQGSSDPNVLTPPGLAFRKVSSTLVGFTSTQRVKTLGAEVEAYRFNKPTESVVALWSLAGAGNVDLTKLGTVRRVHDQYGRRVTVVDARRFPLNHKIVYVTY